MCFKWFTRETADKTPEDRFQPLKLVFLSGHVQQGNEQSQISHKAKRRKVQEDKQGEIEKLGRVKGTVEKLGGKREQNRYIAGSILRLNLLTPSESIYILKNFLKTAIQLVDYVLHCHSCANNQSIAVLYLH